jgi:hypothetical protein
MGGPRTDVHDLATDDAGPEPPLARRLALGTLKLAALLSAVFLLVGIPGCLVFLDQMSRARLFAPGFPAPKGSPTTVTVTYGDPVRLSDPFGLSSLEEMTVYPPGPPTLVYFGSDGAPVQGELTSVDVGVCAGASPYTGLISYTDFTLFLGADTTGSIPWSFRARQPDLTNVKSLGPHKCARGYLTFYTGRGSAPTAIAYRSGFSFVTYRWALAAPAAPAAPASSG